MSEIFSPLLLKINHEMINVHPTAPISTHFYTIFGDGWIFYYFSSLAHLFK